MKFVRFTGEVENLNSADEHEGWIGITKIVPSNIISLSFRDNQYFVDAHYTEKTHTTFRLSKEEWEKLANTLLNEPDEMESIVKKVVKNAIQELEVT